MVQRKKSQRTAAAAGSRIRRQTQKTPRADTFTIEDHCLLGSCVSQRDTPNKGGEIIPRYLVFHHTAGKSAEDSIQWLMNPGAKASAHLVVARDGQVTQLAPFNIKTWHAGKSHWDGLSGLNSYSIGIEMDNAGPLTQEGTQLKAWFGKTYPRTQAIHARHKFEQEFRWWHAFTEIQITRALDLAKLLVPRYGLQDIIGHDDIAPDRKRDPGPAFPLEHIRAAVMGRREEEVLYTVTATSLNIRKGPGIEFETIADPLPKSTRVKLLEKRDRWSKVEALNQEDVEGWVSNTFLEQLIQYEVTARSLNIRKGPGTEYSLIGPSLKQGTRLILLENRDPWSKVEVVDEKNVEGWVSNAYLRVFA